MDLFNALTLDAWSALVQSLAFGIALAVFVRLALLLIAPANASTRFVVWFATLAAVAVMPFVFFAKLAAPRLLPETRASASRSADPVSARIAAALPASSSALSTFHTRHVPAAAPSQLALLSVETKAVDALSAEPRATSRATTTAVRSAASSGKSASAVWSGVPIDADEAFATLCLYAFVVALLLFGRLGFSYARLRRIKANTIPAPPELLEPFKHWLNRCRTTRRVSLLISTQARSPMAVGFLSPAIILPDSLLLEINKEELEHLGLHELAHVRRYDDWTNLAQRIIRAVMFYHPAIHWICRKLDFEREVACDDWVLTLTGAPKSYARSLVKILEHAPWQRGPVLASGAVFRKRQIFRRVEALLDASRDSRPGISVLTVVVVLMCVVGAFSQMVQSPSLVSFFNDGGGTVHRSRWSTDGRSIESEIRGDVQFGDDDLAIELMSPSAMVKLSERNGWSGRQLQVRQNAQGRTEFRYLVNNREQPFDAKARQWASALLTSVIRESGIDAERRAARILSKQGPSGLFQEIDRIHSDYSRRQYLLAAISSGLQPDDLRRAMMRAARISADHEKANLLLEVQDRYDTDQLRLPYFDAVNTIKSDHDRRRVLTRVIEQSSENPVVIAHAARSIERISSDHDKAELLRLPAIRFATEDLTARRALLEAAASINSDHDKANVLAEALKATNLQPELMQDLLRVAEKIQSDNEKARVLELAVGHQIDHPAAQAALLAATRTINSDNERSRVLHAFIQRDFGAALIDDVSHAAQQISSDNEKANVLIKLAANKPTSGYVAAVRSIQSDGDKRRVLEAMLERGGSVDSTREAVLLAATIHSDHDKAELLFKAVEKHRDSPEIREAVRKAAEKISSDSDYRRVVSKLPVDVTANTPARRD